MLRGFFSGVFWGAVMVTVVAGFASLLAPLPATVSPQQSAAETMTGSLTEDSGNIGATSQADAALGDSGGTQVTPQDRGDAAPLADTASAPQPRADSPAAAMRPPAAEAMSQALDSAGTAAPDAPELPATPGSITANPVQPQPPRVTGSGAFAPQADVESDAAQPEADTPPAALQETPQEAPQEESPQTAVQTEDQTGDQTAEQTGEQTQPQIQPQIQPQTRPQTDAETGDLSPSAEADEPQSDAQSLLKPATDLKQAFAQHGSERLPSVGSRTEPQAQDAPLDPAPARPFESNAVAFTHAEGRPLMSIVLIDDSAAGISPETLRDFPYPLSIAVNTLAPDRAERVARYQALGFEILAMIDLPAAAAPSDVEMALEAHLSVMPQAVAVIEGVGDGLQGSKPMSDQVTAVLKDSGHGLVLFANGLDTARKLASRDGVPAASVFRDFDSKGQTATVIRRFLDQAAFKADQEGGVIMVGRLREETLEALLIWGLQDRAASVALAPVSAVIAAKQP